jgi:beta-galactosidase
LGVSEYGAGASIYQHEQDSVLHKGQALSPWHPEGLQAQFHEEYWRQIKARPWLWGTYIWNLFDFASAGRDEGDTRGRNDKGLVTTDRQTRKDAFYWYQANWTTKPMVHIVSKRYSDRTTAQTEIKIYSNADEVEAKLNGVTLGRKSSIDCRFIWSEVELKPGVNRIEAGAWRDEKLVSTDSCSWNYQIDPILRGPATARPVPPPNP